jgi:hypothetical protein
MKIELRRHPAIRACYTRSATCKTWDPGSASKNGAGPASLGVHLVQKANNTSPSQPNTKDSNCEGQPSGWQESRETGRLWSVQQMRSIFGEVVMGEENGKGSFLEGRVQIMCGACLAACVYHFWPRGLEYQAYFWSLEKTISLHTHLYRNHHQALGFPSKVVFIT